MSAYDPHERLGEDRHTAASAESLLRLGIVLALAGADACALLTDIPAPGVVDAADLICEAADLLSVGQQS